jgi:CubicO group peptidase (beta-lactamase class C family)
VRRAFPRTLDVLARAARAGDVPGGVVAVADAGEPLLLRAVGHAALLPRPSRATVDTVYDLASLTKVVCTTSLAMLAVARGRLDLDGPAAQLVPELAGRAKRAIRIRDLLAHASGLPAHRPFYERLTGRDALFDAPAAEPLEAAPRTRAVYSDLGFLVLGRALERALDARLDVLFAAEVARPLGVRSLRFIDLARPGARPALLRRHAVAPTQVRGGRARRGAVDDDNAFAMRGVAPHAGLFGAARDVLAFGLALCRAWHGGGFVPAEVVRGFCTRSAVPGSTRALGWDTPASTGSSVGTRFPRDAVGHLGYTGGSLWLAPARGLVVVLLTNRVHPSAANVAIRALRPALHDAVMADLA